MSSYKAKLWSMYYCGQFLLGLCTLLLIYSVLFEWWLVLVVLSLFLAVANWLHLLEQVLFGCDIDPPPKGTSSYKKHLYSFTNAFSFLITVFIPKPVGSIGRLWDEVVYNVNVVGDSGILFKKQ